MADQQEFLKFPRGKISPGTYCEECGRYNARDLTTNVIVWQDNKVLLIKRGIQPFMDYWGLPGGYLDWDETIKAGAQRELFEETGLVAPELELVTIRSDVSSGDGRQNIEMFFLARETRGEIIPQQEEVKDAKWFGVTELPDKVAFGHGDIIFELLPYLTGRIPAWQVQLL